MAVRVTVDSSRAMKKLNRVGTNVTTGTKEIVTELSRGIQTVAKAIAPKYSGKTARLISIYQKNTPKGASALVIAKNSTPGRKGGFNLPRWMHMTGGVLHGKQHIRSGHPQFMWEATEVVRRQKKEIIKNILRGKLK